MDSEDVRAETQRQREITGSRGRRTPATGRWPARCGRLPPTGWRGTKQDASKMIATTDNVAGESYLPNVGQDKFSEVR
jgi:hypothetical protein